MIAATYQESASDTAEFAVVAIAKGFGTAEFWQRNSAMWAQEAMEKLTELQYQDDLKRIG